MVPAEARKSSQGYGLGVDQWRRPVDSTQRPAELLKDSRRQLLSAPAPCRQSGEFAERLAMRDQPATCRRLQDRPSRAGLRISAWLGAVELDPRSCSELRLGRGVGGVSTPMPKAQLSLRKSAINLRLFSLSARAKHSVTLYCKHEQKPLRSNGRSRSSCQSLAADFGVHAPLLGLAHFAFVVAEPCDSRAVPARASSAVDAGVAMIAAEYKEHRQKLGTLKEVAELLGVHWITVQRRESGALVITIEAANAMLWLARGGAGGRKRVRAERRKAPNDLNSATGSAEKPLTGRGA